MVEDIPPRRIFIIKRLLEIALTDFSKRDIDSSVVFPYKEMEQNIFFGLGFGALNLTLYDEIFDIVYESPIGKSYGIGIKTFIIRENCYTKLEKISEHDKDKFTSSKVSSMVQEITERRNQRIFDGCAKYHISEDNCFYLNLVRSPYTLYLVEEKMEMIDKNKLRVKKYTDSGISFSDNKSDYNWNFAKSTLLKTFKNPKVICCFGNTAEISAHRIAKRIRKIEEDMV